MKLLRKFQNDLVERRITKIVRPHTLVGPERIHNLFILAQRIEEEQVPGDVIECGVCNGGTAALLARSATRSRLHRTVWLLDSFEGMPPTTEHDGPAPDGDPAEAHIGKRKGRPDKGQIAPGAGWSQGRPYPHHSRLVSRYLSSLFHPADRPA